MYRIEFKRSDVKFVSGILLGVALSTFPTIGYGLMIFILLISMILFVIAD